MCVSGVFPQKMKVAPEHSMQTGDTESAGDGIQIRCFGRLSTSNSHPEESSTFLSAIWAFCAQKGQLALNGG